MFKIQKDSRMVDENSQDNKPRKKLRRVEDIEFQLKTIVNEFLPMLVLMELAKRKKNEPENPVMPVYLIVQGILKKYRDPRLDLKDEERKLRPRTYNLMTDMSSTEEENKINFVQKPDNGSDYEINQNGMNYLISEIKRFDQFIEKYMALKKELLNE
jgi:hypothetical protein